MQNTNKSFLIILIYLGFTCLISWRFYFQDLIPHDTINVNDFPRTIGMWQAENFIFSKEELAYLDTDNAFYRKYKDPSGNEIYLYIVYSQTSRKISNPPEVFYTDNGGVSILENIPDTISVMQYPFRIRTHRLLIENNAFQQVSFYWFKIGDQLTPNYWHQQILMALNTFLNHKKGTALIRVSAYIINDRKQETIDELRGFIKEITPALFQYLP